jgi:peptide/nickel transport system substrate-binding protein
MKNSSSLTRRTFALSSAAVLVASLVAAPLQAQAQSRKDTVTLGMILEPTSLDPTMAPAAAIGEVVHYNILEGLTKINVDGSISPCWPRAGKWTPTARPTPSSCARA